MAARADVEGDETYVFLRKPGLMSLPASGNHPIWHTGVTVSDSSSTPMTGHWAVDIIPLPTPSSSLPELKNTASQKIIVQTKKQWDSDDTGSMPSSAKLSGEESDDDCTLVGSDDGNISRSYTCLGCTEEPSNCLCDKYTSKIKKALEKAREAPLGRGAFSVCLKCGDLVEGAHVGGAHNIDCIHLDIFDGSRIAWVTKKVKWWPIFSGIQSDMHFSKFLGRPFLLHSSQGRRCEVCFDLLSQDKLYGTVIQFCTIECWAYKAEAAPEFSWVKTLLRCDFDSPGEDCYFCNICRCVEDKDHLQDHQEALRVITDYASGTAAVKVEIPTNQFMASYWKCIKDLEGGETLCSANHVFRLRNDGAERCKNCNLRLENGGGQYCSLECRLSGLMMLPREIKFQFKQHNETKDAQEEILDKA